MALEEFIKAFLAIFIVMDAFGNLPVFYSLTDKLFVKERIKSANKAVFIAAIVLLVFLFFGALILEFFGISMGSFKVAGGILLLILGIKIALGLRLIEERAKKYEIAAVPLATPLITGPGVITTVMILVNQFGYIVTLTASLLNLFITWIVLRQSELLFRILGRQGSDVVARLFGLILIALAVQFIKEGWFVL